MLIFNNSVWLDTQWFIMKSIHSSANVLYSSSASSLLGFLFYWAVYFSWGVCAFARGVFIFVVCFQKIIHIISLLSFPFKRKLTLLALFSLLYVNTLAMYVLQKKKGNWICAGRNWFYDSMKGYPAWQIFQLDSAVLLCLLTVSFWGCCGILISLEWESACAGSLFCLLLKSNVLAVSKTVLTPSSRAV